jgi:chromosome segregation ATPase
MKLSQYEAVRFFRDLSSKQKSPALAQLASRIAASLHGSGDVFGKIKGLIEDMIEKLEDESSADADKKAYCDKELGETNAKHEDKTAEISKLSAKIDQMTAKSAKLKEEVAKLQKELANLAATQTEMDKVRSEEKAIYTKYKAENEKALKGIQLALKVLKDYYAKADKAHGAADGASSGIINLLEVCESDVARGLAEAAQMEEDSQLTYDTVTKDNEVETTTKNQDVKYKTKESKDLEKAVAETTADRSGVQEELDSVNKYLDELHGQCDEKVESYAERKEAREKEIAGLKEGLSILENEAALIQTTSRRSLRLRRAA